MLYNNFGSAISFEIISIFFFSGRNLPYHIVFTSPPKLQGPYYN